MTAGFQKGRYKARLAVSAQDVAACQALRHRCFFGAAGMDVDPFDATWQHMMVEDGRGGPVVCTYRLHVAHGPEVLLGYAAQFYDLTRFSRLDGPLIEIGRFCCDPATPDPHILRVAWGALTQLVDHYDASCLFGCTSFAGTDAAPYADIFARLGQNYLGPDARTPLQKAKQTIALHGIAPDAQPQRPMPPLLRTYLAMGGWVSDHAVVDAQMQTLHVLTVLDIANVPPARAKALRALV